MGSSVKFSLSVWREGCAASLGTDEKANLGFSAPLGLDPQALGARQPRFRGAAVSLGPSGGGRPEVPAPTAPSGGACPLGVRCPCFLIFVSEQRHGLGHITCQHGRGWKLRRTPGGT